ncbi:MAG: hypothetical protein GC203_13170 [Phenylobacterium sp.]|uniref:hypothetical protein n=1 Tax=Phenylobacterium sp. TaxID=1871053 RepID=UPI0025D429EF|nr:hypothetical protein [Phenylobacterium sp.]MBI1198805.1 hypothetical protein [Phenylobacterium sp.]
MKRLVIALGAVALLGGCASDMGYGGRTRGYDAWYDGAYGPYYDGYWRGDVFWYSPARGRPYVRDDGRHFRRDGGPGFHGVHGRHRGHWRHDDHDDRRHGDRHHGDRGR